MRIVSGTTGEKIYFVAFSTADHLTRVTGLTSFASYLSVAASTGAVQSTAAVTQVNSTQMPGVYAYNLADSTILTLPGGVDSREVCLHINSSMDPVTRTFEVYRGASVSTVTALSTADYVAIADTLLDRDMSVGTDSGSPTVRTVRQALRFMRNKWAVSAGTLTVYKEDDATASWASAVTGSSAAAPVVGSDPAGP